MAANFIKTFFFAQSNFPKSSILKFGHIGKHCEARRFLPEDFLSKHLEATLSCKHPEATTMTRGLRLIFENLVTHCRHFDHSYHTALVQANS